MFNIYTRKTKRNYIFLSVWWDNFKSVNKNKEKVRKIENNFFLLWDWYHWEVDPFSKMP